MSKRNHQILGEWGKNGTRPVAAESYWRQPLKWNHVAEIVEERHRVFCGSLMDVFEGSDTMPNEAWGKVELARRRLFLKVIPNTPLLDWLLLTKRPENIMPTLWRALDPDHEDNDWNAAAEPHGLSAFELKDLYPNVWIGTTVEDQKTADERIPHLLNTPAAVRFLSVEPLLGEINLQLDSRNDTGRWDSQGNELPLREIVWIIVGTESGTKRRPAKLEWIESIVDQCKSVGVPVFVKQIELNGKVEKDIEKFPSHLQVREFPEVSNEQT